MQRRKFRKGSILILAMWILAVLGIFAVNIGLRVRQRINLNSHLEQRSQLRYIAEAGVKKAIAGLKKELSRGQLNYTPFGKYFRHNNPESFSSIKIGRGIDEVIYSSAENPSNEERYGVVDEESKINLNVVDLATLKRLIENVVTTNERGSEGLAEAILDWRDAGQSQLTGFYSDDYYSNLTDPYESKNSFFETLDELLLVNGVTEQVFDQLIPFVTIYGDGQVNINTASSAVLLSLGLDKTLVDKILAVRRGVDSVEATMDDYIFQKAFDIASELKSAVDIEQAERQAIDLLNSKNKLKTNAIIYSIQSRGKFEDGRETITVWCVYNAKENRIEYWREKHEYSVDSL